MIRKLTSQFQKEICPYCFEYFHIKDTPFRCSNIPSRCAPEYDKKYDESWEDSTLMGHVIPPKNEFKQRFVQSVHCDVCDHQTHKRLCPHCHSELPQTTGQFKNHIYAVIGAKDSGKSHYIAVLIDQIKKVVGPQMGLLLTAENDFTIKRYKEDFYEPIFDKGKTIDVTQSAITDRRVQKPMVYSIRITGNGLFEKNKTKKYITLVFFDTAGEDLEAEDTMSTVNKYIYRADGIILLVDPLQLSSVRKLLPNGTPMPVNTKDTEEVLDRTCRLIQKGRGLNHTAKIKTPLAIAFSKFDALLPLVDPQLQLHNSANHNKGFDQDDFEAINDEMSALLDNWNGQHIIHIAKTRFSQYGFFGLSALGCNPHDTHTISSVLPSRVEDPFLWLLANSGVIKKVKRS